VSMVVQGRRRAVAVDVYALIHTPTTCFSEISGRFFPKVVKNTSAFVCGCLSLPLGPGTSAHQ
jgi:hypothetical protein